MGEEVKKISFGFSKLIKKTKIVPSKLSEAKPEEKKVELIDCLESNAIKLKNQLKPAERLLVIPMRNQLQCLSNVEQEHETVNTQPQISPIISPQTDQSNQTLQPPKTDSVDIDPSVENQKTDQQLSLNDNSSPQSNVTVNRLTLDEIAAKEILEDLKGRNTFGDNPPRNFSVPLSSNITEDKKESSLEDYENIPVTEYGMAMLRGMGWAPGKGIGKNEKLVTPSLPTLRPKGMGLGADKVIKNATNNTITNEDLKMQKGSFIRVIVGSYKDSYGQIEGFDDESGRLIVKLALRNVTVSLNEFMVQLVDKGEFTKNSKVLNVSKYEQYKGEENKIDSDKEKFKNPSKYEEERHGKSGSEAYKNNSKYSRPNSDKCNKKDFTSSESELSDSRIASNKIETLTTSRKSRDRASKSKYRSSSKSSDDSDHRKKHSPVTKSLSKGNKSGFNSKREVSVKERTNKSSHKSRSVGRESSISSLSSSSSYRTDSSSDSTRRRKHKKKKPSSHKPKSRSRSRSPRKHSKNKKHKKRKY